MAKKTKEDQTAHELFLAEEFVDHLAQVENLVAEDLRVGDQEGADEPDAVCTVGGKKYGIELVDLWPSGRQAKVTWDAATDASRATAMPSTNRA